MKLTNEQIQEILDGAPDGSIAIGMDGYVNSSVIAHRLSDLREILELRQEIERVKSEAIKLLDAAICPCCDKSGAYYDNYGEVCQCQWCDEVNKLREKSK